jgi:hypothetical protein
MRQREALSTEAGTPSPDNNDIKGATGCQLRAFLPARRLGVAGGDFDNRI